LLLLGACSGEGNTGQPIRDYSWCVDAAKNAVDCTSPEKVGDPVDLWKQVPWANHATPQLNADNTGVQIASTPIFPPIGINGSQAIEVAGVTEVVRNPGTPDLGSAPVDCSGLDDIEVSPYFMDNFEPLGAGMVGMAPAWSGYDDGSDTSFRVPGDVDWYPGLASKTDLGPYGMPAERHDAHPGARPDCGGVRNDWTLHYRGGRFNYYGAGMAKPFAAEHTLPDGTPLVHGCPAGSDLCPALGANGTPYDIFGVDPSNFAQVHEFFDVSKYDGVVFWARRGPDGATGLLVGLQDKYTSDDLARDNQRFCKRIKVCTPGCVNGNECIVNPAVVIPTSEEFGLHRCMPPNFNVADGVPNVALREFLFPRCGPSTCVPPVFYPDNDLKAATCQPYEFTGLDSGYWCTNPGETPAPYAQRCGDAFVAPISLSTDWQLYKLPFDSFRQVGFGKVAPTFDLKSLYSIAFQFTVGFTDVYVDNVSFYRNK
jgi:hypothetical protein